MSRKRRFRYNLVPRQGYLAAALLAVALSAAVSAANAAVGLYVPASGTSDTFGGTISLGCTDLDDAGSVFVRSGQIVSIANVTIEAGGVLDGGSGLIQASGNWTNSGSFLRGTGTVSFDQSCSPGVINLGGNTTFNNLTLNPGTYTVSGCPGIQVTGVLNIASGVTIQAPAGQTACITEPRGGTHTGSPPTLNNVTLGLPVTTPVPALSQFGMLLLVLLMSLIGVQSMRLNRTLVQSKFKKIVSKFTKGARHV